MIAGLATTAALGSTAAAAGTASFSVPAHLIALTGEASIGSLWVLTGNSHHKEISLYLAKSGAFDYSEPVSPRADDISLSANGGLLALGTSGGKFPAVILYNAHTGRFTKAIKSAVPITRVSVSANGANISLLRGKGTAVSGFILGVSNGLGFTVPLTTAATTDVDLVPAAVGHDSLVLQSNGTVLTLCFPSGAATSTIATGAPARAMVLSPDGSTLYVLRAPVAGSATSTIAVVNLTTGKVVSTMPVSSDCVDLSMASSGATLYEGISGAKGSQVVAVAV